METEEILNKTLDVQKKEHAKLLKLFNGSEKCFGEGTAFATIEEYNIALSAVSGLAISIAQVEQSLAIKKAQKEQASKMKVEAKK